MTDRKIAIGNDYDSVLEGPNGARFYNVIISNSPRVWTSRAHDGSYCEELHMNLSVGYKETSCRFIEYNTWVKLANMADGDESIQSNPALQGMLFDTKMIKQWGNSNIEPSACGNINCNSVSHNYQSGQFYRKSPIKAALIAISVAVILVVVITVPIVATRHAKHDNNANWDQTKY